MPPIRFIHAADLHLDAAFSGLSRDIPADFAERLRTATFTAFRRLLDLCERESPDFLLLAGDVYNQEDASVSAQLALRDGFRRLESLSIPVFLVHGNHDPLASRLRSVRWPGNVTVCGELPDAVPVFRKGEGTPLAIIHGASHASGRETRNLAALCRRTEACGLHVGLLHATPGDADGVARYAPFSQEDLKASGMDYWALGHIHQKYAYPSFDDPRIAFSGCIQGRDIRETGERGVFQVTLRKGRPNEIEFIPTASVVWQRMRVDVSDCSNLPDVTDKIMRELFRENGKARCEEMVARIVLEGATPLHALLERPDVLCELRKHVNDAYSEFFCDALVDATVLPRDKDALRAEGLFPSVFLQVAEAQRRNPDDAVAFLQDEFLRKNVQLPSSYTRMIDELAEDAENLVLDLLLQGDER